MPKQVLQKKEQKNTEPMLQVHQEVELFRRELDRCFPGAKVEYLV